MNKPVIGISISQVNKKGRLYYQNPSAYSEAVIAAGGLPLLIPTDLPPCDANQLLNRIDGLLLSGGGDVDLQFHAGLPHPAIADVSVLRDQLEFALLRETLSQKKPVLGICRGMQVLNVALGGTLHTHIPDQYQTNLTHSTPEEKGRDFLAHSISIEPLSKLAEVFHEHTFLVNSFHHQAVNHLAEPLKVTARASDGLIEAIELQDDTSTLIGVQWHPECLIRDQNQLRLFISFISAC